MKKSILNLGKALNKTEQKSINGGEFPASECVDSNKHCNGNLGCPKGQGCYINENGLGGTCLCIR